MTKNEDEFDGKFNGVWNNRSNTLGWCLMYGIITLSLLFVGYAIFDIMWKRRQIRVNEAIDIKIKKIVDEINKIIEVLK